MRLLVHAAVAASAVALAAGVAGDAERKSAMVSNQYVSLCTDGALEMQAKLASIVPQSSSHLGAEIGSAAYEQARKLVEEEGRLERAMRSWSNGIRHLSTFHFKEAAKAFQIVTLLVPDMAVGHCKLGLALKGANELENARGALSNALALDAALQTSVSPVLGDTLSDLGDWAEACRVYKMSADASTAAIFGLARCAEMDGQVDRAVALLRDGIAHGGLGSDVATHVRLGSLLCRQESWEEGVASLKRAVELNPKSIVAQTGLGDCLSAHAQVLSQYGAQKDTSEEFRLISSAISSYQQATWLDDAGAVKAHLKLGQLLVREKRFKEAFSHAHKAAGVNADTGDPGIRLPALLLVADLQSREGNFKAAEAHLLQARELHAKLPSDQHVGVQAHDVDEKIATVLSQRNQFGAAALRMRGVVRAKPNDALKHALFARILLFANDLEEALEMAQRAVWLDDRCGECYLILGLVEIESRAASAKVLNILRKAATFVRAEQPLSELHLYEGAAHASLQHWDEAKIAFKQCLVHARSEDLLKGLCLHNLAVSETMSPTADMPAVVSHARSGLQDAYSMLPSGCSVVEKVVQRHWEILSHLPLKSETEKVASYDPLSSWFCSRQLSALEESTTQLILSLAKEQISAPVMDHINSVAISGKEEEGRAHGWAGWMADVVTSIVGEKREKNTTKVSSPRTKPGKIFSVADIDIPPMVVPGAQRAGKKGIDVDVPVIPAASPPAKKTISDDELLSMVEKAKRLEDRGDWASAAQQYETAIIARQTASKPVSVQLFHSLGRCTHYSGDTERAMAFFNEAIFHVEQLKQNESSGRGAVVPPADVASLLADAGMAHDEEGNLQRAANLYMAAIDADSTSLDAYFRLAQLLVKDQQPETSALIYYRLLRTQVQHLNGVTPRPMALLMDLLFSSKRCDEARVVFHRIEKIRKQSGLVDAAHVARQLSGCGHYEEAIDYARKIVEFADGEKDASHVKLLSSLIKEQGAAADAQMHLDKAKENSSLIEMSEIALALAPESRKAAFMVDVAAIYSANGNKEKAESMLRESISMMPTKKGLLDLAGLLEDSGIEKMDLDQLTEIVRFSEQLLKLTPVVGAPSDLPLDELVGLRVVVEQVHKTRKVAWQRIVRILAFLGNWDEAKRQVELWLSERPGNLLGLTSLTEIHYKGLSSLDRAVELLEEARKAFQQRAAEYDDELVSDTSSFLHVILEVGATLVTAQRYDEGIRLFRLANEISADSSISNPVIFVRSLELEANTYFVMGDNISAKNILLRFFSTDGKPVPNATKTLSYHGIRLLGDVYKKEADSGQVEVYEKAIFVYRAAVESASDGGDADLHYVLGSSLLNNASYEEASKVLGHAFALNPENSHICNNLGVALYKLGRLEEAQNLIERSVKLNDGCHARFNLGAFLEENGQPRSAARHFRHAIKLCRRAKNAGDASAIDEADIQLRLAKAIQQNPHGKLGAAIALYKSALRHIRYKSDSLATSNALADYASLLSHVGRHDEAIENMYEALELRANENNETRLQSRVDYGNILLHAGKLEEAQLQYEIVLKGAPNHATAFNNMGVVAYRKENFDEAIQWFSKVLSVDADHVEAKQALEQITPDGPRWKTPALPLAGMSHGGKSTLSFSHDDEEL